MIYHILLGDRVTNVLAAFKLTEEGITNFVKVEVRDKLWGRMHSTSYGAPGRRVTVELGTNRIQGTQEGNGPENPTFALSLSKSQCCGERLYECEYARSFLGLVV